MYPSLHTGAGALPRSYGEPGDARATEWGADLYLPMPFAMAARIDLRYDIIPGHPSDPVTLWYHIELERQVRPLRPNIGRFHAQWRRENPTVVTGTMPLNVTQWDGTNTSGCDNFVAVEAEGQGQMVGLHLQIDNIAGGWYGEGDDMVFVDGRPGDQWPPTYHGAGTEEIFGGGACPNRAYSGPYTGFHLVENSSFAGKHAMYRWFLADPIRFSRSLVWTVEHGHANNYENDYTSVAYWYQAEPHAPFPHLPGPAARLPRFPDAMIRADAARAQLRLAVETLRRDQPGTDEAKRAEDLLRRGLQAFADGRWDEATTVFQSWK